MTQAAPPSRCPLCEIDPQIAQILQNRTLLLQCPQCHLAWWNWPVFSAAEFYDRDYFQSAASKGYNDYQGMEPGIRRTARHRLERIASLLPADRPARPRLFEIGCGPGVFLDEAQRAGWQASGCEVSQYAAAQARNRGIHVHNISVQELHLPADSLDCVVLWDVIEHLPDPFTVIQSAARSLRRGGLLALSTGDIDSVAANLSGASWHLFNLPEHLYFFSGACLNSLLARNGLRVVRCAYEWQWIPLSYGFERLAKNGYAKSARLLNLPMWKKITIPATLWDVLGIYAIRT